MVQLLSGYMVYAVAFLLIYIALATLLQLQFSITGIVNFGIAGFWGLGMYAYSVLVVTYKVPFLLALLLATVITGIAAWLLGGVIMNLDGQSVLVATLAFATIIEHLATTERWLTNGVMGFGTVPMPLNFGRMSLFALTLLILVCVVLLLLYVAKLRKSPYGRLLQSIQDNEILAQSLGKPTFKHKVILFAVSCAAIGLFGALTAPLYNYIFPRMIGSAVTFTVWIALMLGGRKKLMGGLIGVLATVGLFDYFIEIVVPIPRQFAELVPNLKFAIYGLMLILVLMFRPLGILGDNKKGAQG